MQCLDSITESIIEFQLRRIMMIIDKMYENEETIKLWKIQRFAGLRISDFNKI